MADVFLSYKRDERPAVEQIASSLRALGLTVWFDASMSAGETFNAEIDREARAAKAILVCWSPAARQSEWVNAEAMIGFELRKLAACYVAGPDGFSAPTPFNATHAEDLRAWFASPSDTNTGWKSVLRRIGRLCNRADIENWAALDASATAAEVRAWIEQHRSSPLLKLAETFLTAGQGGNTGSPGASAANTVHSGTRVHQVGAQRDLGQRVGRFALVAASLAVLGVIATIAVFGVASRRTEAPLPTSTYEGVELGWSREEVLYRLGQPQAVIDAVGTAREGYSAVYFTEAGAGRDPIPDGKAIGDYPMWTFVGTNNNGHHVTVEFGLTTGTVSGIHCVVQQSLDLEARNCAPLYGVNVGDAEERIVARLGQPTTIRYAQETKTLCYVELGAEYKLRRGQVYSFSVSTPQSRPGLNASQHEEQTHPPSGNASPSSPQSSPVLEITPSQTGASVLTPTPEQSNAVSEATARTEASEAGDLDGSTANPTPPELPNIEVLIGRWTNVDARAQPTNPAYCCEPCTPGLEIRAATATTLELRGRMYSGVEMFRGQFGTYQLTSEEGDRATFVRLDRQRMSVTWTLRDNQLLLSDGRVTCVYRAG